MTEGKLDREKRVRAARNRRYYHRAKAGSEGRVIEDLPRLETRIAEIFAACSWLNHAADRPAVEAVARAEVAANTIISSELATAMDKRNAAEMLNRARASVGLTSQERRLGKHATATPQTDERRLELLEQAAYGKLVREHIDAFIANDDLEAICPICRRTREGQRV